MRSNSQTTGRARPERLAPASGAKPDGQRRGRSTPSREDDSPGLGIWERYRDNTPRHLMGIARDFQNRAMRQLAEERGYLDLRPSFGPPISLVALEARPLGALAERLSISPQACSQLVNLAEDAGYLERRPDPADRRSRLVSLTDRGRALVGDAVHVLHSAESDYRALIGARAFARLTEALGALSQGLGVLRQSEAGLAAKSLHTIGVLPLISVELQQQLMDATTARGHAGLKMSHAQVLPMIGAGGARVSELARIQRVSRQAISTTARDLEGLGYLRREADPRDRRGVVFRLTEQGNGLIEACVAALDEVDAAFRKLLGEPRQRALEATARELYQALHLEEEIFEARTRTTAAGHTPHTSGGIPGSTSGSTSRETSGALRAARPSGGPDDPSQGTSGELERLAESLRRQLGARDAGRLAALLEDRT